MALYRSLPLTFATGACLLCCATSLFASGGWYDNEPSVSTLGEDLDRLPAKTLGEILLETAEKGRFEIAEIQEKDAVSDDELNAVIDKIGKKKPDALAAEIDDLVMKARLHYVLHGGVLNTLYDIRDAITAPGPTDGQRKAYCEARVGGHLQEKEVNDPAIYAEGDPMRAHLLLLKGAALFTDDKREDAALWFQEVVKKLPNHPRAETAAFLLARCALTKARSYDDSAPDAEPVKKKLTAAAVDLFRKYLEKYPKGRYVADAHGWIGGLIWKDQPAEALEEYIAQLEDPAHPECRKSAAHMTELVLSQVVAYPDKNEAILKVVARHPRIAQAAVYLVLNAPEIDPYDGKYDDAADLKKWKLTVLPKLAAAVSAEKDLYKGDWTLRMRAMLAQAASSVGQQDEALKLTDVPQEELEKSDDLLFARMVVFQRMGKPAEVAKAGQLFFKAFKDSQLSTGAAVRLAQALVDDHCAGEAYVLLSKTEGGGEHPLPGEGEPYPPEETQVALNASGVYYSTQGGEAFAVFKTTILNFAPLKELEAVLNDQAWKDKADALLALNDALRVRKAAQEDFAEAAKFGGDDAFKQRMVDLAKLAEKVKGASGKAKAQAMIELGDAFEDAFGDTKLAANEGPGNPEDDLARRDDARALGFANPDDELESRNLMRHATKWWLRAARTAPGTDLSANARSKVLEGIEQAARNSDYDFTRAIETNMAQVSREIYDILQKENPKSKAAHDAVYWSFEPCPKPKPKKASAEGDNDADYQPAWRILGQDDPDREEDALSLLGGYHALPYQAFGKGPLASEENDFPDDDSVSKLDQDLSEKAEHAGGLQAEFTANMAAENFKNLQDKTAFTNGWKLRNLFEDLTLFYQVPGLSDHARSDYIQLRLRANGYPWFNPWGDKPDPRPKLMDLVNRARANPELAKVQDFVDYVEIYAEQAERGGGLAGITYPDYASVEQSCRAFLKKYPKSVKRQACSLVLIRSLFRQLPDRFGHKEPGVRHEHSMDDPRAVQELDDPFQPEALVKAIAAYEKEFPKPRYAAEMRNYKGIIAWREFRYGPALELTIAQLEDVDHPDLRPEAAVRLANIFADLRDARHRPAVLAALKTRPAAVERLKMYLDIAPRHSGHPLRCMGKYVFDQLGFK